MNLFAETLLRFVLGIVWWVVLFPVLWLAAAPIILVLAAFQQQHYLSAVRRLYRGLTWFWIDHGMLVTP